MALLSASSIWKRISLLGLGVSLAVIVAFAQTTTIKNTTGSPLCLNKINSDDHTHYVGEQCISGSEATLNQGRFIKGAGFYQMAGDNDYWNPLLIARSSNGDLMQVEMGFNRIEWDDAGKTVRAEGLRPYLATSFGTSIKITSDLKHIELKDGVLFLNTERGRLSFAIEFGNSGHVGGDTDALWGRTAVAEPKSGDRVDAKKATSAPEKPVVASKRTIQAAQQQLEGLGYAPGPADGAMGSRTIVALKKFQSDHGLPATGVFDQGTLNALGAAVKTPN
jgi:hypothetical protein